MGWGGGGEALKPCPFLLCFQTMYKEIIECVFDKTFKNLGKGQLLIYTNVLERLLPFEHNFPYSRTNLDDQCGYTNLKNISNILCEDLYILMYRYVENMLKNWGEGGEGHGPLPPVPIPMPRYRNPPNLTTQGREVKY